MSKAVLLWGLWSWAWWGVLWRILAFISAFISAGIRSRTPVFISLMTPLFHLPCRIQTHRLSFVDPSR